MKSKLVPLNDRIIVKENLPEDTKTEAGIIIPKENIDPPGTGEIIAVGPGNWYDGVREPMDMEVGDTILFNSMAGKEIEFEGITYKVMRLNEVELKIKEA